MKNNYFKLLIAGAITSLYLLSCSKTDSIEQPAINKGGGSLTEKGVATGTLTGTLTPAPQIATVYAYADEGDSYKVTSDVNGNFRFDNLPAGVYGVVIQYISSIPSGTDDKYHYHKLSAIRVSARTDTNLGYITLY